MNVASAVQSAASVNARENGRPRLSREAPVLSRPTSPGHRPEIAGEKERVVLAHDAVARVRRVEPVNADANHRVVDGAELLDGVVGLREDALDAIGIAP
jgi:hypothetical protein